MKEVVQPPRGTAAASADANTLDDYEEGTWTAFIGEPFASDRRSFAAGTYAKEVEKVVIGLALSGQNAAHAEIDVSGLPFPMDAGARFEWTYRSLEIAKFAGVREKVLRARAHVSELTQQLSSYRKALAGTKVSIGGHSVRLRFTPVGLGPSAIIGDVVHNLRSALDVMASELVRANGKSDADVCFPFSDGEASLAQAIHRTKFDRAGASVVRLAQDVRPYRGGNEYLSGLRDLNNADKHRALLAAVGRFYINVSGSAGAEAAAVDAHDVSFFFSGPPFQDHEVVSVLNSIADAVDDVVQRFVTLALGDRTT